MEMRCCVLPYTILIFDVHYRNVIESNVCMNSRIS